jgi:LuxR family maltose regulon positive regulatory protein
VAEPLIATKLSLPAPPARRVERQRLYALLDELDIRRVLLVSAPAGFGKTTLVSTWLAAAGLPATWLALDPRDNDPARFFSYLISALQQVDHRVGTDLLPLLHEAQPFSSESLTIHLVNQLAAVERPFVLVLDDWHLIDDPDMLQALALLIEHQPAQLRLVLITREDPALPLSRLRARGELVEIRVQDLRFTSSETADFLRRIMGLELDDAEIDALEARIEGWIAGLTMAALSMRGIDDRGTFIREFSGSHRFVLDYLLQEVIERQPPEIQQFLLYTAILDRMCGPLCDALLKDEAGRMQAADRQPGNNESAPGLPPASSFILSRIEAANLFLLPLDYERRWFRYHHLFADLLRARLVQRYPEQVPTLQRRASAWFEAEGLLDEAADHAFHSGDAHFYADLLERHLLDLIGRGEIRRVNTWLQRLPDAVLLQRPRLCLDQAWACFLTSQYTRIEPLLESAEQARADLPANIQGEVLTLRAFLALDDPELVLELAEQAHATISLQNSFVQGLYYMALANGQIGLGRLPAAVAAFEQAIPIHWKAGNRVASLMALIDSIQLYQAQGRLGRAMQACREAQAQVFAAGLSAIPAAGMVDLGFAAIYIDRGELDQAATHLRRGNELSSSGGTASADYGRMLEIRLHTLRGDRDTAGELINELLAVTEAAARLNPAIATIAGLLLVECNHPAQARAICDRVAADTGTASLYRRFQFELIRANALLLDGLNTGDASTFHAAVPALTRLLATAEPAGWTGHVVELLTLRSLAQRAIQSVQHQRSETRDRTAHADAAFADLERALVLAEPEQNRRFFLNKGAEIADLLRVVIERRGPAASFAASILERLPPEFAAEPESGTRTHPELVEPLSQRELEVLQLMTEGLTYGRIAERLIISVNTVRFHVKSLYGKLAVASRAEAIARARELGMI